MEIYLSFNKYKKKEEKKKIPKRKFIKEQQKGCSHACDSLWCNIPHADVLSSRLYDLWQRTEWVILPDCITCFSVSWTIRSSDGICVSIKPYLKIFCLFKNSLNSPKCPVGLQCDHIGAVQKWLNWNLIFFHLSHYGQIESPAAVLWPGPQSRPLFRLQFDSF